MDFRDKVIKNLEVYKRKRLCITEKGVYQYKKKKLPKDHILPKKYSDHNIISQYRNEFYNSPKSEIKFHRYFHHLNSSQALCVNLFFPLMIEGRLDIVLEVLGITKIRVINECFEKESEIEEISGAERKTSFDFYLEIEDCLKVYFEIKYTESAFGKVKDDDEHRVKFNRIYQPLLFKNKFIKDELKNMNYFLANYQIMRNLIHLNDNSSVVFLYPEGNKKINKQAINAYNNILNDDGKNRFKIILLERIINDIEKRIKKPKLCKHYKDFKFKYLNYEVT